MPKKSNADAAAIARVAKEIETIEEARKVLRKTQLPDDGNIPFRYRWLWEMYLSGLPYTAKLVANAVWMFTRKDKPYCNPSHLSLRGMTELGDRALRNAIYAVRDAGFLEIVAGRNHDNSRYTLRIPGYAEEATDGWHEDATCPPGIQMPPKSVKPFSFSSSPEKEIPYTEKPSSLLPQKVLKTPAAEMMASGCDDGPSEKWFGQCFAELKVSVRKADRNNLMCGFMWNEKGFMAFMERAQIHGIDEFCGLVYSTVVRENYRCSKMPMSIRTWAYFREDMMEREPWQSESELMFG